MFSHLCFLLTVTLSLTGEVKIFYNSQGEITIQELATHYRVGRVDRNRKTFVGRVVEFDNDNHPIMEINYDSLGFKTGRFKYSRFKLKFDGEFVNNKPGTPIPDSILSHISKKEKFTQAIYIRKKDYPEIREVLFPVYYTDSLIIDGEVFRVVEENAEFPGGMNEIVRFLDMHLVYPEAAQKMGIHGRVFVEFTIKPDGSVDNVKAIKGIGAGCDEAAVAAVTKLPDWKPGRQHGKPVPVRLTLPIRF